MRKQILSHTTLAPMAVSTALLLGGCAIRLPDQVSTAQPAVITLNDSAREAAGVQLIVLAIDGAVPPKAGPVIDSSRGGPADRTYEAGTVVSQPPLRPARWNFAVDSGTRELALVFAVPGSGFLNLLALTRAKGSEAVGVRLTVQPGCEYQIAAKLTLATGRDFVPEVRSVRPIPSQFGLPAAAKCPDRRDVPINLMRSAPSAPVPP